MADRLRVALVSSVLSGGGAERVIAHLARHLDPEHFDVHIVVLKRNEELGQALEAEGYPVHILGRGGSGRDYTTAWRLRRLVKRMDIDLLHSHDIHGLMDCALVRLSSRQVRHIHTFHFGNYPHLPGKYRLLEGVFGRLADRLVAVGENQRESLLRTYRFAPGRVARIWNGVTPFEPRDEGRLPVPVPQGRVVVGSLSTLIEQKGIPDLIEAVRLVSGHRQDFHVLVAGDGPLRERAEALVESAGVTDFISFIGWIPDAASRILGDIDIFVQSSRWEAMSMVVLEAMAAGRAMVITDVGENPRVVDNDRTGLVVPAGQPERLAEGLERLVADPALRQRLGDAAREAFRTQFTAEHMAAGYARLYEQTCSLRRGRRAGAVNGPHAGTHGGRQ